jgi:hypothetical protein
MRHMHAIRWVNLAAAILQVITAALFASGGFKTSNQLQPISEHLAFAAPYVYNIWWVLFLLTISYSLYMLFSKKEQKKKDRSRGDKLCKSTSAAFALSSLWMILAKYFALTLAWPLLVIICVAYIFLFQAMLLITQKPPVYLSWRYGFKTLPICLYAGWLGLAIFISTGTVVDVHGLTFLGLSPLQATATMLVGATILAGFALYFTHAEISYLAGVLWGLIGIYVGNLQTGEGRLVSDTALGMMVVAITLYFWFRKSHPLNHK